MAAEENKALVRRFYAITLQTLDELDELLVPNYVHPDPSLPSELQHGRAAYKQVFADFYTALPDLHAAIGDQIAEGDKVVTRLRWQGTHQAELMGIPPTGKRVDFPMLSIHRIQHGRIAEGWVNFDALGMMQQLGAIPAPDPAPASTV